jgi:putative peptidoglycan lipid II flippase
MFRSAALMSIATFISRILGLGRELLIAAYFGASGMTDAFWVAFRVPNMLRDLFAEGNFNSAFLPVLTEESKRSQKKGLEVFWSAALLLFLSTTCCSILILLFSEQIVGVLAPTFKEKKDIFDVTVTSIKVLSFFLPLISLAALSMSYLNTKKVFFAPALAPASLNVMMIISIVFLTPILISNGVEPIYALTIGAITGGATQLLVQIPFLIKNSAFSTVALNLFSKPVKKILYRMSIGTVGVAATQINLLVGTFLATGAGIGSVSYLTYALRLYQFPVGIFGVSLSNSNLVFFSDAIKSGKIDSAKSTLKKSYHLSLFILIPVTFFLWQFSEEVIYLIFERGAFGNQDREMTTMALKGYLYGLPFYCIFKLLGPTFYALDKEKVPILISIFSIFVNIIFSVSLIDELGFVVLAYGVSLSVVINSILQIVFLRPILNIGFRFFLTKVSFYIVSSGTISFVALCYLKTFLKGSLLQSWTGTFLSVFFLGLIFCVIYVCVLYFIGGRDQIDHFISKIKKNKSS